MNKLYLCSNIRSRMCELLLLAICLTLFIRAMSTLCHIYCCYFTTIMLLLIVSCFVLCLDTSTYPFTSHTYAARVVVTDRMSIHAAVQPQLRLSNTWFYHHHFPAFASAPASLFLNLMSHFLHIQESTVSSNCSTNCDRARVLSGIFYTTCKVVPAVLLASLLCSPATL